MRSIIFQVFGKTSPFDGLVEHAEKVTEGVRKFKESLLIYLDGDFDSFDKLSYEVMKFENEADTIKVETRSNLRRGIFIPVDKRDLLACLKEQDSILDICEDAVIWLQFRKTELDPELKENIRQYLFKVVEIVESLELMVKDVHRLICSLSIIERKSVKNKINEIHFEEEEIDKMERSLVKGLFAAGEEKNMMNFYHLIHLVFLVGHIADHAENAADRLKMMLP
jgi:predicted phosphate transport protein (TIGR00153 family)